MPLLRLSYLSELIVQRLTLLLLLSLGAAGLVWSVAAAAGLCGWLQLHVGLGGEAPVDAGRAIQLILTALLVGLCFFIPSNDRVLRLETSHRNFRVTMKDVAQAYQAAHAVDRTGAFELKSEFDSVRERIEYMRRHPDLERLEPEILEAAAQMSHESRALAEIYSTERVERARRFLQQRQEEVEDMKARIQAADAACCELKRWLHRVNIEEDIRRSEIARLKEDLLGLLPYFGLQLEDAADADFETFGRGNFAAE